jgi:hypothetical protein
MALAGKDRWKKWGDDMRNELSQNTTQSRLELRTMLRMLRLDLNRALVEHRARFAQSADWEKDFSQLLKMHLRSSWHLFALDCMPLLTRCGFHMIAPSVPARVAASYEGIDLPTITAAQMILERS